MKCCLSLCLASLVLTFASCSTTEEIACDTGKLAIMAVGFRESDFDSAVVVRYAANGSFTTPIDTAIAHDTRLGRDTFQLVIYKYAAKTVAGYPNGYFEHGADYRLFIPRLGRSFSFTDITLAGNTHQTITHSKRDLVYHFCVNEVVSCSIDGVRTATAPVNIENAVFIRK